VAVPGDISSAAFFLVAGAAAREARVTVRGVGVNPTRTGVVDALRAMGAHVTAVGGSAASGSGEPSGDLTVTTGPLHGTQVGGELIPRLIDEIPALAVVACAADGVTVIRDAAELRVKESDRIAALAAQLGRMGADIAERPDGLEIRGGRGLRGAVVQSGGDHRMAMALIVAGLTADGPSVVEDTACIATSFPGFLPTLNALAGAPCAVEQP
jgi:3-phosphoshikimate 1-carboxyvinyltransferase